MACRTTDEKRDLLRVVRQPDGSVLYDPKGKLSGRGAYVCASADCIALARKQKKLERALKVSGVPEELFTELSARAVVPVGEESAPGGEAAATPAAPESTEHSSTSAKTPQKSEVEIR